MGKKVIKNIITKKLGKTASKKAVKAAVKKYYKKYKLAQKISKKVKKFAKTMTAQQAKEKAEEEIGNELADKLDNAATQIEIENYVTAKVEEYVDDRRHTHWALELIPGVSEAMLLEAIKGLMIDGEVQQQVDKAVDEKITMLCDAE